MAQDGHPGCEVFELEKNREFGHTIIFGLLNDCLGELVVFVNERALINHVLSASYVLATTIGESRAVPGSHSFGRVCYLNYNAMYLDRNRDSCPFRDCSHGQSIFRFGVIDRFEVVGWLVLDSWICKNTTLCETASSSLRFFQSTVPLAEES